MSKPQTPKPESTKTEELRIGVFVCHCGLDIAGTVDLHAVAEYARIIPSNWHYSQPILISTAFQKGMEAVERRTVMEDVV